MKYPEKRGALLQGIIGGEMRVLVLKGLPHSYNFGRGHVFVFVRCAETPWTDIKYAEVVLQR